MGSVSPTTRLTRSLGPKIWGATDADAVALSRFAAAASGHTVRRLALALISAVCLVEREMQTTGDLPAILLGDRAREILPAPQVRRRPAEPGYC